MLKIPLTKEQKTAKKAAKALDEQIAQAYYRHASGLSISVLDIGSVYKECKAALLVGSSLDDAMIVAVAKYCKPPTQ